MTVAAPSYVIDAGVAVKTMLIESLSDRADRLLELPATHATCRLFVPDLFFAECANVLWKHVSRGTLAASKAAADLSSLRRFHLEAVSTGDLTDDALRLALTWSISAYDTCYVALAEREAVPLVTADEKLVRKMAGATIAIEWLGNLALPTQ